MTDAVPYYWKSLDWNQLMRDYPPPPMYFDQAAGPGDAQVRAAQQRRFLARVREAWQVPFYRDRWAAAGLEPGDIAGLDDLAKIPVFTSDDLKDAGEQAPPFGSHHPFGRDDLGPFLPLKIQTSGGTTGLPRTTMFDTISWEVQGIQVARALWAQGMRPGDIVQIPFTNALGNAPWSAYTAIHHWAGGIPLTTGSGVVTPSERQLQLAAAYGTNGWYAMGEYLGHLVDVAEKIGMDLHQLPTRFLHGFLGVDPDGAMRRQLEDAWGAPVYDNYGAHEIGEIAFECRQHTRHVHEDTVYLQTADVDDPWAAPETGSAGDLIATSLHRSVPPIIRYNLRDSFVLYPPAQCDCGLSTLRLSPFLGRSDEMVKLRGTNVYPMACQHAVAGDPRTTGEFLCVVSYEGTGTARRERMVVRVERRSAEVDAAALHEAMTKALKQDLGVRVDVEIAEPGQLAEHTRLGGEGKVRRLLDLRRAGS